MARTRKFPPVPYTVRIRDEDWDVRRDDAQDLPPRLRSYLRRGSMHKRHLVGLTSRTDRVILLRRDLRGEQLRVTFIHELLHACCEVPASQVSTAKEEAVIEDIDTPLWLALTRCGWIR